MERIREAAVSVGGWPLTPLHEASPGTGKHAGVEWVKINLICWTARKERGWRSSGERLGGGSTKPGPQPRQLPPEAVGTVSVART